MKLSIIIPVYNSEKYIARCLDSILNSGMTDYEIICVDDGSIDNSLQLLQEYEEKYNQILVLTQKNSYAGIARNHGMQYAQGEYVHFMDIDDVVVPGTYVKAIQLADRLGADYVKVKAEALDTETGQKIYKANYELTNIPEVYCNCILPEEKNVELMLKTAPTPWAAIVKRSYIEEQKLKFNGLRCVNDRSFFMAAISHTNKLAVCKELLVQHYINNKESLVGIRHKNFECHYESYQIVSEMVTSVAEEKREPILLAELSDIWYWYCLLDGEKKEAHREKVEKYFGIMPMVFEHPEDVFRMIASKEALYLYGAGKVAEELMERLKQRGLSEKVRGILVTKKEGNPEYICGVLVSALEEAALEASSVVLLSMYTSTQAKVMHGLVKRNIRELYAINNEMCDELVSKSEKQNGNN